MEIWSYTVSVYLSKIFNYSDSIFTEYMFKTMTCLSFLVEYTNTHCVTNSMVAMVITTNNRRFNVGQVPYDTMVKISNTVFNTWFIESNWIPSGSYNNNNNNNENFKRLAAPDHPLIRLTTPLSITVPKWLCLMTIQLKDSYIDSVYCIIYYMLASDRECNHAVYL